MRRWMVLGALTVAGCVSELHGALTVDWQVGGKRWTMTPDGCTSGQREGFFGVDLVAQGKDDSMVRVILDPRDGPVLRVNVPDSDKALTLTRSAACKNFDVHVERQHSTINGITNVAGHLRVSCEEPGLTLAADITFDACH